jgi:hypothetical protein
MQGAGFEYMNYLRNIPRWGTALLLIVCGICIGILLSLALLCGNETTVISTLDSDYEVIVNNFLGYEQLMVIKQL